MMRALSRSGVLLVLIGLLSGAGCGGGDETPTPGRLVVEHHTVTTRDGVEIALFRYVPEGRPVGARPILLCPGFSENHRAFDLNPDASMCRTLAARGIEAWAIDFRGRGLSGYPPGTDRKWARWSIDDFGYLDIAAAAGHIAERAPAGELFLLGFSEGDAAVTAYLLEGDPGIVCGHIGLAPGIVLGVNPEQPDADWPPSQRLFSALAWLEPLIPADRYIPFKTLVAGLVDLFEQLGLVEEALELEAWNILWNTQNMSEQGVMEVLLHVLGDISTNIFKQYLRGALPLHWSGVCTFPGSALERDAGPFCYADRLGEIEVPTLILAGSVDLVVPPRNARFLFDRLTVEDRTFRVIGRAHGDSFDYGHDDLTFGVHAARNVFPVVASWIEERM